LVDDSEPGIPPLQPNIRKTSATAKKLGKKPVTRQNSSTQISSNKVEGVLSDEQGSDDEDNRSSSVTREKSAASNKPKKSANLKQPIAEANGESSGSDDDNSRHNTVSGQASVSSVASRSSLVVDTDESTSRTLITKSTGTPHANNVHSSASTASTVKSKQGRLNSNQQVIEEQKIVVVQENPSNVLLEEDADESEAEQPTASDNQIKTQTSAQTKNNLTSPESNNKLHQLLRGRLDVAHGSNLQPQTSYSNNTRAPQSHNPIITTTQHSTTHSGANDMSRGSEFTNSSIAYDPILGQ
jgi:hypothetical protein